MLILSRSFRAFPYGTILLASSLHGPGPIGPLALTRTQWRTPLGRPWMMQWLWEEDSLVSHWAGLAGSMPGMEYTCDAATEC